MINDATLGARVKQTAISFSASGDNTVIGGVVGRTTKVLQMFLVVGGNTSLTFKSGAVALTGAMAMLANGAIVLDYIQLPLTCLTDGDNFIINSGSAVGVGGTIWYIQT